MLLFSLSSDLRDELQCRIAQLVNLKSTYCYKVLQVLICPFMSIVQAVDYARTASVLIGYLLVTPDGLGNEAAKMVTPPLIRNRRSIPACSSGETCC